MFNPVREAFKGIYKEKKLFFSSLLSLIVVFTIFNIFSFGLYTLYNSKIKIENSNKGIVYIKDMENSELNEFGDKLLNVEGIYEIEYTSKESAIKVLEKELNIDLSEDENPLLNSFYISINKDVNINELKEKLISIPEIIEIDINIEEINKVNIIAYKLENILKYVAIGIIFLMFILINNIMSNSVIVRRNEIKNMIESDIKGYLLKFTFVIENFILLIISSLLSFFIVKEMFLLIGNEFNMLNIEIIKELTNNETIKILLMSFILGIVVIIYSNFIGSYSYYKKNKELEIDESSDEKNIEITETVENQEDKKEIE